MTDIEAILQNSPEADALERAGQWKDKYDLLDALERGWPEELKDYRRSFDRRYKDVVSRAVEVGCNLSRQAAASHDFERADRPIKDALALLPARGEPGEEAYFRERREQLENAKEALSGQQAEWQAEQAVAYADRMLELVPPDYPAALRRLQAVRSDPTSLPAPARDRLEQQFNVRKDRAWPYYSKRSDDALQLDRLDQADEFLRQYEDLPGIDESDKRKAESVRKTLDIRRIDIAIVKADKASPEDAERSFQDLSKVRGRLRDLKAPQPELVHRWFEAALKLLRLQKKPREAYLLLKNDELIVNNPWAGLQREQAARDWAKMAKGNCDELLAAGKVEEAAAEVGDVLAHATPDIGVQLQEELQALISGRIALAEYRNSLKAACHLAETDPLNGTNKLIALRGLPLFQVPDAKAEWDRAAHAAFRTAIVTASGLAKKKDPAGLGLRFLKSFEEHLNLTDESVRKMWCQETMDALCEGERYLDAVLLLQRLGKNDQWRRELDSRGKTKDVWKRYFAAIQRKTADLLAGSPDDKAAAWDLLRRARVEPLSRSDEAARFRADLDAYLDAELDKRLRALGEAKDKDIVSEDFDGARDQVRSFRKELGDLVIALDGLRNKGLPAELDAIEKDVNRREFEEQIRSLEKDMPMDASQEQFVMRQRQIAQLLERRELPDEMRGKLTTLQHDNVGRWERWAYGSISDALDKRQFDTLSELVRNYETPPIDPGKDDPRSVESLRAVEKLRKDWIDWFDVARPYPIAAITLDGIPAGNLWNYTPLVKIEVYRGETPDVIKARKKGADRIRLNSEDFPTNWQFRWRKGDRIVISVWDYDVDKKGCCMGRVELTNAYSLLRLCLGDTVEVNKDGYDESYKSFPLIRVGFEVDGMNKADVPRLRTRE
jgi:hypothetical protein